MKLKCFPQIFLHREEDGAVTSHFRVQQSNLQGTLEYFNPGCFWSSDLVDLKQPCPLGPMQGSAVNPASGVPCSGLQWTDESAFLTGCISQRLVPLMISQRSPPQKTL